MNFNQFSWNRIRTVLYSNNRDAIHYIKDGIVINFKYYQQSVMLHINGRGILFHPNNKDNRPVYLFLMPKDIEKVVNELWETYTTPIPINLKSN